ncbi:MAG TPA: catalase family protein [Tianweitania sediminis]|nr:catalase family protein [Tianweitania sediminis]
MASVGVQIVDPTAVACPRLVQFHIHRVTGGRGRQACMAGFSFTRCSRGTACRRFAFSRYQAEELEMSAATQTYVPYADSVEATDPDERRTFDRIADVMGKGGEATQERYNHYVRVSHAKAHGLLGGELRVMDDLAPELAQGLFAAPRTYPVAVRLAQVPGEVLDDRRVSTPRGMALKVFDVDGEKVPGHEGATTQDFVLDTGKVFIAPDAKTFLAAITATEAATPMPEGVKAAVSHVSLKTNTVLNAVGLNSAKLDFYGHPKLHPLVEPHYSQAPIRYGNYIAKISVTPDTAALRELAQQAFEIGGEDGLRRAVREWFATNPAEFVVAVQLCTDLDRMPVEDASKEWPENESPYRPVARLVLPPQDAFSERGRSLIDEDFSFAPSHSLAAHRPLGSLMRARMHVYEVLGRRRREVNGRPVTEPRSLADMPAPPTIGADGSVPPWPRRLRSDRAGHRRYLADEDLHRLARGLGWFSLGLGAVELLAPEKLDRILGVGHHPEITRAYGLREIGAGVGILLSDDPTPWVWARVAGDALDLASLAPALERDNPQRPIAAGAFANVALISALDIFCAAALSKRR